MIRWLIKRIRREAAMNFDFEIIRYGFKVETAFIIDVMIALIACTIIHKSLHACIFILCFSFLRIYCGGYHCKTYFTCGFSYVAMILLSCLAETFIAIRQVPGLFFIPLLYLFIRG
ncbi:MAG: accessory gene regulator B family protein [Solobacterium sp.]|nr:accessory gene regulator B family protein [Solobacterium sp.]